MRSMPSGEHKMMFLVVHAASHHSKEAETSKLWKIGSGRTHRQFSSVGNLERTELPAVNAVHGGRVGEHHAADGVLDRPAARNPKTYPLLKRVDAYDRHERDFVHVDEMVAQSFYVDPRPIGCRVCLEDPDDLLDCTESSLSRLGRQ